MVGTSRVLLDEWPIDKQVFLTLDLECDYGTAIQENTYEAARETPKLASILEQYDVPLSCFLQTELLERSPRAVEGLEDAGVPVEFHAHSHTHPSRDKADVEYEIQESVTRIRSRFNNDNIGFRFPDGAADPGDYSVLSEHGIPFSASLFPSWRPGRFNNTGESLTPFRDMNSNIIEIPFTVYSSSIRIPVSLSYLKLVGRLFEKILYQNPPTVVIFDMHMHDFVTPHAFSKLPKAYQLVYSRRQEAGFSIFRRFIQELQDQGYTFELVSELHSTLEESFDV
ncbi:Polysaccharide deacetylase [Halovenus aranensis]|uniref:Polysaccharide deacetylase n=1 Tax=Halovenus aranensis TaxID=890420 RepID=A0A1G8ZMH7_9EURY|nr:polysaccharide deacetylase family protein [Halovenus aranensis]SDK15595.1 Polysaccharide deacetylase [Halovenus aranensis]